MNSGTIIALIVVITIIYLAATKKLSKVWTALTT